MKLITKKIVSLFAAITMIASMLGVVASADGAGYVLTYDTANSDSANAVIKVQVQGITGKIEGGNMTIPLDETVFDVSKLTGDTWYKKDTGIAMGFANYDSDKKAIVANITALGGLNFGSADQTLYEFTLPLVKSLSKPKTLTIQAGELKLTDNTKYVIGATTEGSTIGMTAPEVEIPRDPNVKPDTETRPDEETVPPQPAPVDPQPEVGLNIVLDKSNTDLSSQIVIKVQPKGITGKIEGGNMTIPLDETVFDVSKLTGDTWYKKDTGIAMGFANYDSAKKAIVANITALGGLNFGSADQTLYEFTLPLVSPLVSITDIAMTAGELKLTDNSKYVLGADTEGTTTGFTAPVLRVDPEDFGTKPAVKKTAALKDYTDKDATSAAKAAEDAGKTTYMTVDVKKEGAAATYGSDFIAKYDGQEIKSVEEFKNIVHGYVEDKKISDVIAKMTFEFYTDGKFTISTTVNAEGEETQLVNPVTDKTVGGGNDPQPPKPAEPKFTVSFNPSRPDVGETVEITAEMADATDVTITFDEAAFKADTDSANLVSYLGIYPKKDVDNSTDEETKYLANTWEFKAMAAGELTVPFKVSYTKTSDGTKVTDEVQKATVTINEVNDNNGGNGGSSSGNGNNNNNTGGGAIAPPANNGGNGLFTSFSDLDQAEWAKQAIMVLSVKGIVSGYGDGTFNPNGNITRAEYCQILIGAIGKTNLAADVLFNDVPSEAWYYHAVSVANSLGIVSGYGDGNFGPNDLITRQDMALMTYKAAQVMNKDVSAVRSMSFADAGSIAEYAATAVQTLADAGIINGVSDTEFAPVANATRAQAAKILYDTFVKVN